MSNELIFIIGFLIGALIGLVSISIFAATRITDLQSEVRDLRVQRKLLKEELEKPKGKPTPRKKRYRIQPRKK
jgi:gas vesicle protein